MRILRVAFLIFFVFSCNYSFPAIDTGESSPVSNSTLSVTDTLKENQLLYNGRVWRNLYFKIKEDQFFLSKDFLPGSITIEGITYRNLGIRYDIYNDEISTPSNNGLILQINKEKVDSFNLFLAGAVWKFVNIREDTLKGFNGFLNELYYGESQLYVKYRKEIELLAVDKKYDLFSQSHKIYLVKDNIVHVVSGKRNFLTLFDEEDKQQLKDFIKRSRLVLLKKKPENFVPLLKFYDNLR